MFNKLKNKFAAMTLALLASMATFPALASGGTSVDVTSVVSAIEAAATPIGAIGAAVLIVLVAIKVYKWVRRAM